MTPTRCAPLALAALLLWTAGLSPGAAEDPDLAAAYEGIKAHLKAGNATQARELYEAAFAPRLAAFPEVAQRLDGAFRDAAAHLASGESHAYALDRQVIDKSLLQAAFLGTVEALREQSLGEAEAWFGVLEAKFPRASEAVAAFEAMEREPASIEARLPEFERAMALVFAGKVREEVQEVLGFWDEPAKAEEKAVEGIAYAHSVEPYVAASLGAAQAEELEHELDELREAAVRRDRAAAEHAAEEALAILAAFEAPGAAEQGREAVRFLGALDGLVREYNGYVRDGVVVNRENYEAEVLGLFLPQVEQTWAALRPVIAARDAAAAQHLDADVGLLGTKVRQPAPNTEVEALALDIKADVERVLGPGEALARTGHDALAALRETEARVDEAVEAYAAGQRDRALQLLGSAYLDVYAPRAEASVPRDLNAEIELLMNVRLRDLIQRGAPLAEVQAAQAALRDKLRAATEAIATPATGAGLFGNAFLIVAREGFEAALVIAAVVAYLVRVGHREKARHIYLGAGLAVLASLVLFALLSTVFELSGASREILEGATALLAVAVLFYVSYWLIDKVQITRWNRFIQGKVRSALTSGRSYALVGVAFLAVFREGLETVLFYQALLGSAGGAGSGAAVLGGFAVGLAVLAVIVVAFLRYGVKIPMRPFFVVTSAMLYYLAFSFMGSGVHELQEAGVVGTTAMPGLQAALDASPALASLAELLGVFATVETLAAQALLVLALAGGLVYSFVLQPRREARREAAAQFTRVG